jgi:hypothetical protein
MAGEYYARKPSAVELLIFHQEADGFIVDNGIDVEIVMQALPLNL